MNTVQIRWPRVLATLSLDLFKPFQPAVGIELDADEVKDLCRGCLEKYIPDYQFPSRGRRSGYQISGSDLAAVRADAEVCFGLTPGRGFFEHMEWVWADFSAVWDWFAYEMAFGGSWPDISPSQSDPLGIGSAGAGEVYRLYDALFRKPARAARKRVEALREQPLSDWDARVFFAEGLTFEEFSPDAAPWFPAWVNEPIRRELFRSFNGALLKIIDQDIERRIRATVEKVVLRHTRYPVDRPLARLSHFKPILDNRRREFLLLSTSAL